MGHKWTKMDQIHIWTQLGPNSNQKDPKYDKMETKKESSNGPESEIVDNQNK